MSSVDLKVVLVSSSTVADSPAPASTANSHNLVAFANWASIGIDRWVIPKDSAAD